MTNILILETTCDETAAAVVDRQRCEVRWAVVASQDHLHQRFGGVVPEIASRAHVERILPVIDETLRRAGAAAGRPSTPWPWPTRRAWPARCWSGWSAAKALCVALGMPLVAVNHLQAHIYACRLAAGGTCFPAWG